VVGSASIWVLGRVAGPAREATVVHAHEHAVYLDFEGAALAIMGARAIQLPIGVRTLLPELPEVATGTVGQVQDGVVAVGDLRVLVTSIVDTTVPVLSPEATAWGHDHVAQLIGDRVRDFAAQLPSDAVEALGKGDPAAVTGLLGVGPGLSPLGDDTLAGFLATAVAIRHPCLQGVRSEVALSAFDRTTLVAASLLACAARGEAVPEFRSFISGVSAHNPDVVSQSLDLMLEVGGHSGAGLVIGAMQAFASVDG
jgi:hypothetical protein